MKKIQKTAALLILLALVGQVFAGCAGRTLTPPEDPEPFDYQTDFHEAGDQKNELTKISENSRFVLWANLSNGETAVEDKREGKTWYSNPVDRSEDSLASGFHKNAMMSVVTAVYTTTQGVDMTCAGYMSSVKKDGLYYRLEKDGSVTFLFDFPKEEFMIPVRYAIGEDCFTAEIIANGVLEYGTNTLKSIDLLPYFGAGGVKDEGYMLVPDGSGALIYYNNRRTGSSYSKPMYGFDNGTNDKVSGTGAGASFTTLNEHQYLPVFGVHQNDRGFLAVVTQGAARAGINANVSYKFSMYNTVWSTYFYRSIGSMRQTQKDGSETVTNVAEKKAETWQNYAVSFYFLKSGEEHSGYAAMAETYREYLIKNQELQKQVTAGKDIPLYLDLYGYIEKTKSFMGIPVEKKISMTTVEDAERILDELARSEISNVVVKYNYWAKNSYFDKLPVNAGVDGKVGNTARLQALQERLEAAGGGLYLSADLLNVYKTGHGVSRYDGVLRSIANTAQRQYSFTLDAGQIDPRYGAWYLLRPTAVTSVFDKFTGKLTGAGYHGMALDALGEMLYSELGSDGVGRNRVRALMAQTAAAAAGSAGLMLTGANEYAAVYARHILRAPSRASGYDLEDVSVPFYQMVFHGYTSYSLDASNLSSNPADMTLTYLEYGAYPLFSLIGQNADELIGSRVDHLYSADAGNWMEFIAAQYGQLNGALSGVQECTITGHSILSDTLRAVAYDNGVTVYVNYGSEAAEADGVSIQPKGYAVVSGGRVLVSGQAVGR